MREKLPLHSIIVSARYHRRPKAGLLKFLGYFEAERPAESVLVSLSI